MSRLQIRLTLAATVLLLTLGTFAYKNVQSRALERAKIQNRQITTEVHETLKLQRLWKQKGLPRKLESLKQALSAGQIERFEIRRNKAVISLKHLEGRQLNDFLGKLGAIPVQIEALTVRRQEEQYSMECRCKW